MTLIKSTDKLVWCCSCGFRGDTLRDVEIHIRNQHKHTLTAYYERDGVKIELS